jgi:HlyD family secretion protein
LLLSSAALHDADSAAPWVLRVEDGRAVKVPVKVGLRSGGLAEMLQGVQAGDLVLPGAAAVQPGQRVRATAALR